MKIRNTIRIKKGVVATALCASLLITYSAGQTIPISYAYTATAAVVSDGPLRVRTAPVDGERITSLSVGTPITILDEVKDCSDGYSWYKIQFTYSGKNFEGYVRSDYVTLESGENTNTGEITTEITGTGTVSYTTSGVYVRSGAGTGYSAYTKVYQGQILSILGQTTVNNTIWYNVTFTAADVSYTGWICGDYVVINSDSNNTVTTESDSAYIESLKSAGFPESYCTSLLALHQKYPSWEFVPVQTGLDWATVISQESIVGKNLVQNSLDDSRKSTESAAYDWAANTWYGYDGANWVCASSDYIAYCMDPRNFLNETYIFQFETLEYETYQNSAGVGNILAGTFMSGNYTDTDGVTRSYADTFAETGILLGVSPYHLASRCKQEQGTAGSSPLISGSYSQYNGYYNYFNINAYTTSTASAVVNGLAYAKSSGWNSIYKSINGGASIVADRYIKKGQNTIYFEKFNVVNQANLYSHQYMTNVMAAISEGSSMSKAYTDKSAAFVFRIPVYNNMPETAVAFQDKGNPNNWLSSLSVEGYNLTPTFYGDKTEYSMIVDSSVSSVTVNATAVASKSSVSGIGKYSLSYGNNVISITCISQSGASKTYNITIVRQGEGNTTVIGSEIPISEDASITTDYRVGDNIAGIQPGTSAATVISNITAKNCSVKVLNADGSENTGNVGTGNKITLYVNNQIVKQYDVIVYGDISGDGRVSNADLVMMQKQILKIVSLEGCYYEAANISKDGGISNKDLVLLQKHILNIETITQ